MANGIRTGDPRRFNKGHCSKFHEGSQVQQKPEIPVEITMKKTLNDKNQKFRQLIICIYFTF